MVLVINSKSNLDKVRKTLSVFKIAKKLDAKKYCGVLRLKEDALTIQKRLRNEWE